VAVAEIGDISRFPGPGHLCSWAGLTPRHRQFDLKVARGHITKQGSPILRWAMVEAIQHQPADSPARDLKDRIITRRGAQARNIAKTAAARKLLTCVFYALRDGQVGHAAASGRSPRKTYIKRSQIVSAWMSSTTRRSWPTSGANSWAPPTRS
jgi:Transposase IS116/IS110/IS902 family